MPRHSQFDSQFIMSETESESETNEEAVPVLHLPEVENAQKSMPILPTTNTTSTSIHVPPAHVSKVIKIKSSKLFSNVINVQC